MYRKTYVEINKKNITNNIKKVINNYPFYEYYFGIVKADCYNHGDVVDAIIKGGCNYLAVATLDEAIIIRNKYKDIPILCLEIIDIENLKIAKDYDITITVASLEYAKQINMDVKIHVKLNTGMNRLGVSDLNEFNQIYKLLPIEGVYSHIYEASNDINTQKQIKIFQNMVNDKNIKIIHLQASDALINYGKLDYINGCRLGIIMYGFNDKIKLDSTFSLHSYVLQIQNVKEGDTIGYDGTYKALSNEKIAIIAIGYADGIIRKNKGRFVYINDKKYEIVGNICMDMLFVKVDDKVNINDDVLILKDNKHIKEVANHLDTICYEVICSINKRVHKKYKEDSN